MKTYSKPEARVVLQSRLNRLTESDFLISSKLVQENVISLFTQLLVNNEFKSVLLYRPLAKWREIDVAQLEYAFSFIRFDYVSTDKGASFPTLIYDAVLVPLYGFNSEGYRLGHGGGWYDTFLATQQSALKIGIGLDAGLMDFTVDYYDIPMNCIITEIRREILQKRNHHLRISL